MGKQHCKTCEQDKDPSEFYASSKIKCKACILARQKELKAGKATGSAPAKKKRAATAKAKATPPPTADSAWSRPAGLGFSVQLEVDENTQQTDIRVDQWNASSGDTQRIWLNQSEAMELHSWLSDKLGI